MFSLLEKNKAFDQILVLYHRRCQPPDESPFLHNVQAGAHILLYAAMPERGMMMVSQFQLQEMRSVDITQVDRSALADIRGIHIDPALPTAQKMQSYLEQIGNPYCFLCGDTPVKIRFVSESKALKQSLRDYFLSLK